jgi:5-methylcytosine-specific restriction endonuclease McrA
MQSHIKNYLAATGLLPHELQCEFCGAPAVDIHHVIFRSKFGSKRKDEQDAYNNLIALCRKHHEKAHNEPEFNEELKEIVKNRC